MAYTLLDNSFPEIFHIPQVVILQTLPEKPGCNRLTIVHRTFAGILTYDTVDQDFLLPLAEPTLLTPEPARRLAWSCRHETKGENADYKCEQALVTCQRYSQVRKYFVSRTSNRNSHRHPASPCSPLTCRNPYAKNPDMISATLIIVQKKPRRRFSSWCL